jgi:hypothetical protein
VVVCEAGPVSLGRRFNRNESPTSFRERDGRIASEPGQQLLLGSSQDRTRAVIKGGDDPASKRTPQGAVGANSMRR